MKLDTSDYYPESPLEEIEIEAEQIEIKDVVAEPEHIKEDDSSFKTVTPDVPVEVSSSAVKPMQLICHFLSVLFVPMIMPVIGIALCFKYTLMALNGEEAMAVFTALTAIFNFVIPCVLVILLKSMGYIKDLALNDRRERLVPYMIASLCMVGTAIFMNYKGAPHWIVYFFMGGAAAGFVSMIVNHWWKISVHAAGVAGLVGMIVYVLMYQYTFPGMMTWLFIALAIAGTVGSARIWLGRHNMWQILAGYAVGFICVFGSMAIS